MKRGDKAVPGSGPAYAGLSAWRGNAEINVDYLLFDSWFTTNRFVRSVRRRGVHIIAMAKDFNGLHFLTARGVNYKEEISTDTSLSGEEIVKIYGKRWTVEVFFKACKSVLGLSNEFQTRSYDSLIAHSGIVFLRYMMLSF